MEGLRCIDDFTIKCLDREHRAYFNTLYAGTTNVIVDLCQEGAYQAGESSLHMDLRDCQMRLHLKSGVMLRKGGDPNH